MKRINLLKIFIHLSIVVLTTLTVFANSEDIPKTLRNFKTYHDKIYSRKITENKYISEEVYDIENF